MHAKFAVLSLLVALVHAQTDTSSAPSPSVSLAPCVLACLTKGVGCSSFTDSACVCTSSEFQTSVAQCLTSNCSAADVEAALALQSRECAGSSSSPSGSSSVTSQTSTGASNSLSSGSSTSPVSTPSGSSTKPGGSSSHTSLPASSSKPSSSGTPSGTGSSSGGNSGAAAGRAQDMYQVVGALAAAVVGGGLLL